MLYHTLVQRDTDAVPTIGGSSSNKRPFIRVSLFHSCALQHQPLTLLNTS